MTDPANGKTAHNVKCHLEWLGKWLADRSAAAHAKDHAKTQSLYAQLICSSFLSAIHSDGKLLLENYVRCASENNWSPSKW